MSNLCFLAPTPTNGSFLRSYQQALHSAKGPRTLTAEHGLPFTLPDDFFADCRNSQDERAYKAYPTASSAGIAKSEARLREREREGKKMGKQVQLEKVEERERSKRGVEERVRGLKRSAFLFLIIMCLP